MATLVLTVVGTVLGGPIGAAIGATLGQVVDSNVLFAPKGREGPRLSDLRLQTSRYGDAVPQIFGAMRVAGSVIWATDLQEHRSKQGGGKGQPSVTTYSYSASLAVALSARRIVEVRRIWADGNLLRGTAGDFKSALGAFRLYDGSEDQPLDPLIAADKGIAATPAHRGIAYAVFEDLQLADFGNRIPSLTFELVADAAPVSVADMASQLSEGVIAPEGTEPTPSLGGYAATGSIAEALSPIFAVHDLALGSEGGVLRLISGAQAASAIDDEWIGASFNGKSERPPVRARGRAEDVPVRLSIRHFDPARDYQAGVQTAQRPGPGRGESDLDLPAVLDAGTARSLAEQRLARLWAARTAADVRCDWRALTVFPGATVTWGADAALWRVEQSEWEAMGVRLHLVRIGGSGVLAPSASAGAAVAQADLLHGPTTVAVVDLPPLADTPASGPTVAVAAAGTQPGWRAAALFVRDAATGALTPIGRTAPPATMGSVLSSPVADVSPCLFDTASTIDVQLLNAAMTLTGADDAALLRGANAALVGRELIQFGEAAQIGPDSWRLRRLLRGRRGTEWAMTGHGTGELFLLLEEESMAAIPDAHAQRGATVLIDAIGIGDLTPAQAAGDVPGQAVLPLAPAHLSALSQSGEWRFDWIRRSRAGWTWADGADVPLAEEQELYRIDLSHGGTVFRSVSVATSFWTYDAAAIAADGAAGIGAVDIAVRQIGTFGPGRPATLSIIL